jgi:hypothetical protein
MNSLGYSLQKKTLTTRWGLASQSYYIVFSLRIGVPKIVRLQRAKRIQPILVLQQLVAEIRSSGY